MALPDSPYCEATCDNPNSDLTDFALLVDLSKMPAEWWDEADTTDTGKLRVADEDGNELPRDVLSYDSANNRGWLRAKYSGTLSSTGTQKLRVYPPSSELVSYSDSDTYGAHNAYTADDELYYPMESGSGTTMVDRTANARDGTLQGDTSWVREHIPRTVVDDTLTDADGLDIADITGNGLQDALVTLEAGQVYWFEQTSRGAFTRHGIITSSVIDAKNEGALWIQLTDDGTSQWVAVVLDQSNGEVRAYKQDSPGTPTGSWTGGVIQASRPNLQDARAWDIDGDGEDEIVYTWEGSANGEGGVNWLDYDGTGDITSSGSYTDYVMDQHEGTWWLAPERLDLSGDGNATDIAFTARDSGKNTATVPGVYWIEEPGTVTNTWTETTIDSTSADWLHLDYGDFFGNGNNDILAHTVANDLAIYDAANSWSKTIIDDGSSLRHLRWNSTGHRNSQNGRDKIVTQEDDWDSTYGNVQGWLTEWAWDGSSWVKNRQNRVGTRKPDDRLFWLSLSSSTSDDLLMVDAQEETLQWFRFDPALTHAGYSTDYDASTESNTGIPDDYVDLPNNAGLSTASHAIMGWVHITRFKCRPRLCGLYDGSDDIFFFGAESEARSSTVRRAITYRMGHIGGNEIAYTSTETLPQDEWAHLAAVWDSGAGEVRLFVNGSQVDSTTGTVDDPFDDTETLDLGRRSDGDQYMAGLLDEFRIRTVAPSAAWVNEEYRQTNDQDTFWNLGGGTWTFVDKGVVTVPRHVLQSGAMP